MIRFIRYLTLAIIAIFLLMFAFANRDFVTISFDPFGSATESAFSVDAPMFVVITIFTMIGVVAGALVTWLSQGRYRRANRQNKAEASKWRSHAEALKASGSATLPRS